MRLTDIKVGDKVRVRRGYSLRPATVMSIHKGEVLGGRARPTRVSVSFDDVTHADVKGIPSTQRSYLFGAVVLPQFIEPAPEV